MTGQMTSRFCTKCGVLGVEDAKFCHSCGEDLASQVPIHSSIKLSRAQRGDRKEPGVSAPPSVDEYLDGDFGEAAALWNSFSLWQRRIWNAAGRPDLLTYPGFDFDLWIIDNAGDDFKFDEFVDDWSTRRREEKGATTEEPGLLFSTYWILGAGLFVGLIATFAAANSSLLSFIGNFASAAAGSGIIAIAAFGIAFALAPSQRKRLRGQILGLTGWVGISFASLLLVLLVAVAL